MSLDRSIGIAMAMSVAFAIGTVGVESPARGAPTTVAVLASKGSRLADDLRRELEASRFVVISVDIAAGDWRKDAHQLPGSQLLHGIVVTTDERIMTVFTRATASETIQVHIDQHVEPEDRLARRRACLSVVEYLRVLVENDPPPSVELMPSSPSRPAPAAASVPAATAGKAIPPRDPPPPDGARPAVGVSSISRTGGAASPGTGSRAPSQPIAEKKDGATMAPAAARPASQLSPSVASSSAMPATATSAADPSPSEAPPAPRQLWELGVGTMLDLESAPGGPTGHLQFLWYLPLDWHLAFCARALWPVLGSQFRSNGNDVRRWTFGAAVSLQYLFEKTPARLHPFIGVTVGTRVGLTESTPVTGLQSHETFTPSASLGAEGGVRYTLGPLIQLFFELYVARDWLIPGVVRMGYEAEAANANSFHASFGVLFDF